MPKRASAQSLVRKRIIAARGASISEIYAPTAIVEANPVPPDIEAQFVRQVNELLDRIRKTAVPAELRAELRAYTAFHEDIATLHNNIVDYLAANMYSPTERLLRALLTLEEHAEKYRERIAKRAAYLKEPMPTLSSLKPLPGLILRAPRMGWRIIRQ
jgi:beta-glucosidase/6-phospho-beta-glucosidase/beta-galactosidase